MSHEDVRADQAEIREQLRDSVRGLLTKHSDVRAAMAAPRGYDETVWSLLCEQIGVAALAVPERYGGIGAGLADVGVVAHELGRTLTPSPLLGSTVLAAGAIRAAGDDDTCARLLPGIADGSTVAALAWTGREGDWSGVPSIRAEGGVLNGTAEYVLDGDTADRLLVLAAERDGVGLYDVDVDSDGVERVDAQALDPTRRLATVRLSDVEAVCIGGMDPGGLRRLRDEAVAVLAAEQTGAAERALERTVDHTLQRHQFGRPIGSFQAVKHRLADAYVRLETARSASHAALAPAEPPPEEVAVARVVCTESFEHIAAEMIQLHGGIAITWEHDAHLYFKRAHGSGVLFGPPQRYVDELGESDLSPG
ncbi:acyl-CoA dehydrogenase [Saccharomonospora sp. CUA-673]|uniref:acyl-CoA dehydrogenase family protein n=1 Tax=Saccharomonospora sp. CUA-673 TaxID=1904969 RepID=UPI0009668645|nr:acyl-CoA dehydrogenase family protein [Saccharomonospora sp. CUA-673]OLT41372.1 acyl-CoA dehydrogenase [Saccharomonospora sp. CUA-673]